MKVLHYTIGFPPRRTGGLPSYVLDLMESQASIGYEVVALYPGFISLLHSGTKISKVAKLGKIERFQIINSLPLPLIKGIKTPSDFMKPVNQQVYVEFLRNNKPDVIHVHTLMGLHKEFFIAAKFLGIKIIFTSHDYFGLAPVPEFYFGGKSFHEDNTNESWNIMSSQAMSTNSLKLFQFRAYPLFRSFKNKISFLRYQNNVQMNEALIDGNTDYRDLRSYYIDIFKLIDFYHFNSNVAKKVYEMNLPFSISSQVVTISNSLIKMHKKSCANELFNVAYIGPDKDFKGYFDYIKFSEKNSSPNLKFHTFGHPPRNEVSSNIIQHGRYTLADLDNVYRQIDIVIVPSKCKETFGLVVLEALSYGKTVYVSENVGAKELVEKKYIFDDLQSFDIKKLKNYQLVTSDIKLMKTHVKEIEQLYGGFESD